VSADRGSRVSVVATGLSFRRVPLQWASPANPLQSASAVKRDARPVPMRGMLAARRDDPEARMAVAREQMTLEQFLSLPEERPALEYIDGEVVQKVPPNTPHSALQYDFCALVNTYARPRRLAWAFPEHRTTYAGRSTVPDVTVYTWDRVPRDASGRLAERNFVVPDIAVEIRSPGQSFQDSLIRCLWYVANGTRVSIAVEPLDLLVAAFRPAAEPVVFQNAGLLDLTDVISGFSLDVGELLAPLDPNWAPDEA
jgi:Uma2 family endonuclease